MTDTNEPTYDFLALGHNLADALTRAAEHQLSEAEKLLADTKVLAEGVRKEVENHARELADRHDRLTAFGKQILEAHATYSKTFVVEVDTFKDSSQ